MMGASVTRWRGMLGLVALLAASPVLADGAQCNAECVSKVDDTLQRCMDRCPATTDPEKPGPFRSCAIRCQERVEKKVKDCSERCVKPDKVATPRKRRDNDQTPSR